MTLFDGIILIIILYFGWKGYQNGLVREVFRIAGVVFAGFVAFQYADNIGFLLKPYMQINPEFLPYAGFALVFLFAFIAVQVGVFFLDTLIQFLLLSIPNRLFGGFFGILKSSLLISIFFIFISGFGYPSLKLKQESLLYKPLLSVAPASYNMVARVLPGVRPYKDTVEKYLSLPDFTDE